MRHIPGHTLFDSSLALQREGYAFISNRCQRYCSPVFAARLLLRYTLCMRGAMAAELFYDQQRFGRRDAVPRMLKKTLLGDGGVQGMDGPAHLQRKWLFIQALALARAEQLVRLAEQQWLAALQRWEGQTHVVILPEIEMLLCKAVCRWAGIPLADDETLRCCQQLATMIDGAGRIGWGQLAARRARSKAQVWAGELIEAYRGWRLDAPVDSAIALVSRHHDYNGERLSKSVAAVELLNLLRPPLAVARFIVFALLELHRHPEWQRRLARDDGWLCPFTQEVRRLYAFFPFIAARVREDFEWCGYRFATGTRVLLDLYGTNRDPASWRQPEVFLPERFSAWQDNPYCFIPQGGATAELHHRCPGEDLTILLIESALRLFCRRMHYTIVEQDLSVSPRRMPMLSANCLVLSDIEAVRA
jgi:fatty-acid peroxygenase